MSKYYYIASGFKEDCVKLLSLFDDTNSIRFEHFCSVWKQMKFAMIYTGRQTYSELLEYCEEVMHIAKEFLFPPRIFKERIGGLYLLYGLYYKMPLKEIVRIRVTQDQWTSLLELQEQLKAGEHLDANFILSTLIHDEAFINTVFNYEWGLEKFYREKQTPTNAYSVIPSLLELTEEGQRFSEIEDLAKEYRQSTSSIGSSSLALFDENFVQDILNDIRNLETSSLLVQSSASQENDGLKSDTKRRESLRRQSKVRPRIGEGFDMDTSDEEDEEEVFEPLENYDPNLAETFDDEIETEPESKQMKFAEVTFPAPHMKFERGDSSSD